MILAIGHLQPCTGHPPPKVRLTLIIIPIQDELATLKPVNPPALLTHSQTEPLNPPPPPTSLTALRNSQGSWLLAHPAWGLKAGSVHMAAKMFQGSQLPQAKVFTIWPQTASLAKSLCAASILP